MFALFPLGQIYRGFWGGLAGYPEVMGKLSALCESLNLSSWDRSPSRRHAPCAGTRFRRRRHAGPPILHRSWTYASQEMAPHRVRPGAAVEQAIAETLRTLRVLKRDKLQFPDWETK